MKEFKVDLEVITPMFLHGADGIKAEIRAPSIKGAMRYWWRAAKAEDNIEKLRNQEESIFGSTKARSKVQIRVSNIEPQKGKDGKEFFDVGTKFSITLSALDKNIEQLVQSIASLWLVIFFGGLGTRSRHGKGNLIANSVTTIEDLNAIPDFVITDVKNKSELDNWIKSNYSKALRIINPSSGTNKYSNLRGTEPIIVDGDKKSLQDSLNDLRKPYEEYKSIIKIRKKRMASRLILKALKVNDTYYSMVIYLNGPTEINTSSEDKIKEFLNNIKNKMEANP